MLWKKSFRQSFSFISNILQGITKCHHCTFLLQRSKVVFKVEGGNSPHGIMILSIVSTVVCSAPDKSEVVITIKANNGDSRSTSSSLSDEKSFCHRLWKWQFAPNMNSYSRPIQAFRIALFHLRVLKTIQSLHSKKENRGFQRQAPPAISLHGNFRIMEFRKRKLCLDTRRVIVERSNNQTTWWMKTQFQQ